MSEEVLLTSEVTGKSLKEIGNLKNIIKIATESLNNHKEIISKDMDLEFTVPDELVLNPPTMAEIVPSSAWASNKIREITLTKVGDDAVLFIRRNKTKEEENQ